ncbi:hypothetical protein AXK11_04635 [Cephaloticoccus primus]|uniref:Methylated-DNA--protein-cysteine methyltransferase n=1 Tax=Cephaloticoccus primus TaxID=1548207 RepID=A0A139SNW9_9BACT|nr:methylated-DNA--[protein]-cysteine S-methyltransferase [Cephaloticoccus primus]KXU36212.1 hypothetical protein AXK11_04635 [Cephaloticoccus primus]
MRSLYLETFATPLAAFSIATNESGAVVATAFGGEAVLQARLRAALGPAEGLPFKLRRTHSEARRQVETYFAGKLTGFELVLAPLRGTAFQQKVWRALSEIPFGETTSYGALAAQLGQPRAARAVGSANGANPICLIVPCHRVIAADGSPGGFAYGLAIKQALLAHERARR